MNTSSEDTHVETERLLISLLKERSPTEKLSMMCSLSQLASQLSKRAIRRAHKGIDEDEVKLIFVELHYGRELADRFRKHLSAQHDNP